MKKGTGTANWIVVTSAFFLVYNLKSEIKKEIKVMLEDTIQKFEEDRAKAMTQVTKNWLQLST